MAATTGVVLFRGRSGAMYSLSIYHAGSDAIGVNLPCTFNGAASATSPTDFQLPEPCVIERYFPTAATGQVTFDANGLPTPLLVNYAAAIAGLAGPNPNYGKLRGGSSRYRIRVVTALAA
jgi:hypothetical protein